MTDKKVKIVVCMGSSCFARGNAQNLEYIEKYTKEKGIITEIDLIGSRCENKCAEGPNIIINGIEYKEMNKEKLKVVLDELAKQIQS
jgi:NADH:ubiquinone oxidoreductase subunit E